MAVCFERKPPWAVQNVPSTSRAKSHVRSSGIWKSIATVNSRDGIDQIPMGPRRKSTSALVAKRLACMVSHGHWIVGKIRQEIQHVPRKSWRLGYNFATASLQIICWTSSNIVVICYKCRSPNLSLVEMDFDHDFNLIGTSNIPFSFANLRTNCMLNEDEVLLQYNSNSRYGLQSSLLPSAICSPPTSRYEFNYLFPLSIPC